MSLLFGIKANEMNEPSPNTGLLPVLILPTGGFAGFNYRAPLKTTV
jgi:hypothetical protein